MTCSNPSISLETSNGQLAIKAGKVAAIGSTTYTKLSNALADIRNRHIGFVFQFHNLLPEFSALENVMMPALIGGAKRKDAKLRALELLEAVGLTERIDHKPAQLSGGEQQRVAIARALINRPSVLFADEPTGNLDTHNRDEIQQLLFDIRAKFGQTIIMVTHDERLADMADRKIVMSDGQIL